MPRGSILLRLGFPGLTLGFLAALAAGAPAHARPLDRQLDFLLSGFCAPLSLTFSGAIPQGLDTQLTSICTVQLGDPVPGGTPPATSGGGAAGQLATELSLLTLNAEDRATTEGEGSGVREDDDSGEVHWRGVFGPFDVYSTFDFVGRERDDTKFETGFDAFDWSGLLGIDRRFEGGHFAGLAGQYSRSDGDFDSGGDFERDRYGFIAYGGYSVTPSLLATASLGYARGRDELDRFVVGGFNAVLVQGRISSKADSDHVTSQLALEQRWSTGRYTLSARAGASLDYSAVDGLRERGQTGLELVIDDRETLSVQSQLAAGISSAFSLPFGAIVPAVELEYVHEFEDDQESIRARLAQDLRANPTRFAFETDAPDRDYVNLRASVVLSLAQRIRPYAQFSTVIFNRYYQSYGGAIGVRISLQD